VRNRRRLGQIYVLCAPSGAGKSTLVRRLINEFPDIRFSISATTRAPRPGEADGRDYHFVDRAEFDRRIEAGAFAEWAEVHGNRYGTPKDATLGLLESGADVLFDIDVQGAVQLRRSLNFGCYVFILPPSRATLAARLAGRGSDGPEALALRLKNAAGEICAAKSFDYLLVNDDLDAAYARLRAIYQAQKLTPDRNPDLIPALLAEFEEDNG